MTSNYFFALVLNSSTDPANCLVLTYWISIAIEIDISSSNFLKMWCIFLWNFYDVALKIKYSLLLQPASFSYSFIYSTLALYDSI